MCQGPRQCQCHDPLTCSDSQPRHWFERCAKGAGAAEGRQDHPALAIEPRSFPRSPVLLLHFTMRRAAWLLARSAQSMASAGPLQAASAAQQLAAVPWGTAAGGEGAAAGECCHWVVELVGPVSRGSNQRPSASHTPAGAVSSVQSRWSHCSCSGDLSLPPPQKVRCRRQGIVCLHLLLLGAPSQWHKAAE